MGSIDSVFRINISSVPGSSSFLFLVLASFIDALCIDDLWKKEVWFFPRGAVNSWSHWPTVVPRRPVGREWRVSPEGFRSRHSGGLMGKLSIATVALISLFSGLSLTADKQVIRPKGAEPNAGWSHGILIDGTLYVSGMGGEDAAGKIPATFEAEMKQSLSNIDAVLKEAGMSFADVVSVQVYLTDGGLFDRMNTVYKATLPDPKPTRTTVVVAKLVGAGHVEITATARK